jgi:ABC-type glycerol-3-phosphate transport system permease component
MQRIKTKFIHMICKIVFWFAIILIALYILFPIYWALISSLKTGNQLMMTPTTFIPRDPVTYKFKPTLENYQVVFESKAYRIGLVNSIIVAGSTTLIPNNWFLGCLCFRKATLPWKETYNIFNLINDDVPPNRCTHWTLHNFQYL